VKSRLVSVTLAAVLAVVALGCSSSAAPPGSHPAAVIPLLKAGDVNAYGNIDPNRAEGCNDNYCGLFMEHLLRLGQNNTLEPELATAVTQPDAVTYVYHLRHGVSFWDGNPMTSDDVVYSLNYQREPSALTAVYFTDVRSIEPDGPYAVVIKLKQPNAGWKYSLSYEGVIFEKSFARAHQGTMGNPGVLIEGTGPWEIKSLDPTTGMELSANPHWWGGKVPVQHISVKFFSTETSEALAMRAGEIDVAFPTNGKSFATTSGARVTAWSPPSMKFFAMNARVGPWSDVHVRRAVAYALNRADLIAAYGGPGTAAPASTIIPTAQLRELGTPGQVDAMLSSLPSYPYDLAKARQQMAESAYPHGFTAITAIDNGGISANDPDVVQVIAAELSKIGITLKISEQPLSKFIANYTSGPPGGAMFATLGAVSPDPSIFPGYMVGSAATYNVAHYTPASANSLLAAGLATSDPARRLSIYGQLLKQVATDVPYVVLFSVYSFTALSGKYTLPPFPDYPGFFSWALGLKTA
jgi:peptide/nickel transport system substrate-binding protein